MAIPDFQSIMLPLMHFAADQQEHSLGEARAHLADAFKLTEPERKELLPSGADVLFTNRVRWAEVYLVKAGLLSYTRRGHFRITDRGSKVLAQTPATIDVRLLEQYPEFREFKRPPAKAKATVRAPKPEELPRLSPTEALEDAYVSMRRALAQDLLAQVKGSSPGFFEKLVVELLVKMGYGGSIADAGSATRATADGGVDGMIKEDPLGLDMIYIQAKLWDGPVGRPEMQKFAGALLGQRSQRGVFITSSKFSREALDYISSIDSRIIAIDGEQLAQLMIDHDVGVVETASYRVKKLDLDYFMEE